MFVHSSFVVKSQRIVARQLIRTGSRTAATRSVSIRDLPYKSEDGEGKDSFAVDDEFELREATSQPKVKINKRTGKPMYEMKEVISSADLHKEQRIAALNSPYYMEIPSPPRGAAKSPSAEQLAAADSSVLRGSSSSSGTAERQGEVCNGGMWGACSGRNVVKLVGTGAVIGAGGMFTLMAAFEYGFI